MNKPTLTMRKAQARAARTAKLLAYYRDLPDEETMLKGVLCMCHPFGYGDDGYKESHELFDTMAIAGRMDEIRGAVRAALVAKMERTTAEIARVQSL